MCFWRMSHRLVTCVPNSHAYALLKLWAPHLWHRTLPRVIWLLLRELRFGILCRELQFSCIICILCCYRFEITMQQFFIVGVISSIVWNIQLRSVVTYAAIFGLSWSWLLFWVEESSIFIVQSWKTTCISGRALKLDLLEVVSFGLRTLLRSRPRLEIWRMRWIQLLRLLLREISKKTMLLVLPYLSLKTSWTLRAALIGQSPRQQMHVSTTQGVWRLYFGLIFMVLMCSLILLLKFPLYLHSVKHVLPIGNGIEVSEDLLPQICLCMQRFFVHVLCFLVILHRLRLELIWILMHTFTLHDQEFFERRHELLILLSSCQSILC